MSGSECLECHRLYSIKWGSENKERRKAHRLKWRTENPEKARATEAAWRAANKERVSRVGAEYYQRTKDRWSKYHSEYREKNNQIVRERIKQWFAANPEKRRAYVVNRRALRASAAGTYTPADIAVIRKAQKDKCGYCKLKLGSGYHVDHIVALSKGGSNWPSNLQLLCAPCNVAKGAKDAIDFAQTRGLLL